MKTRLLVCVSKFSAVVVMCAGFYPNSFEEDERPIGRLLSTLATALVERIAHNVEAARVEQQNDLDKLASSKCGNQRHNRS